MNSIKNTKIYLKIKIEREKLQIILIINISNISNLSKFIKKQQLHWILFN